MSIYSAERRKYNNNLRAWMKDASAKEFRDLETTTSSGSALIPQTLFGSLAENLRGVADILSLVTVQENTNGRPTRFTTFDPTLVAMNAQGSEGTSPSESDLSTSKTLLNTDTIVAKTSIDNQLIQDAGFDILDITRRTGLRSLARIIREA